MRRGAFPRASSSSPAHGALQPGVQRHLRPCRGRISHDSPQRTTRPTSVPSRHEPRDSSDVALWAQRRLGRSRFPAQLRSTRYHARRVRFSRSLTSVRARSTRAHAAAHLPCRPEGVSPAGRGEGWNDKRPSARKPEPPQSRSPRDREDEWRAREMTVGRVSLWRRSRVESGGSRGAQLRRRRWRKRGPAASRCAIKCALSPRWPNVRRAGKLGERRSQRLGTHAACFQTRTPTHLSSKALPRPWRSSSPRQRT